MVRYFHKFRKDEPVQTPLFGYTVIVEVRYEDHHFRIASIFERDTDPLIERKKAMSVYGETQKILQFLTSNGFFNDTTIEYTADVYSRIGNDEIKIVGAGEEYDLINLSLEFETLRTFGYLSPLEPTMIVLGKDGKEVTILMTDLF